MYRHRFFPLSWIVPINMQACCNFSKPKKEKNVLNSSYCSASSLPLQQHFLSSPHFLSLLLLLLCIHSSKVVFFFFLFLLVNFFVFLGGGVGRVHSIWTFPGQGLNLCHSSGCSDSTRSLSHCATRDHPSNVFITSTLQNSSCQYPQGLYTSKFTGQFLVLILTILFQQPWTPRIPLSFSTV